MKSASDGERRYLMGSLATRSGDCDAGRRQWGGDPATTGNPPPER